jgi:hypothetical protein
MSDFERDSDIPRIPLRIGPPFWTKPPHYNGEYYFGGKCGNVNSYSLWLENSVKRWLVVGTYDWKSKVGVTVIPACVMSQVKKCKTPISAMWLSKCGKYVLLPGDDENFKGFAIGSRETDYFNKWLPKTYWIEYYTYSAVPRYRYSYVNREYCLYFYFSMEFIQCLCCGLF